MASIATDDAEIGDYARLAAESFTAASRADDPAEASNHRARAYWYVDLIKDLEQRTKLR
jgi:hypothetical protein